MSRQSSFIRSGAVIVALILLYVVLPFTGAHKLLGASAGLAALLATVPLVMHLTNRVAESEHPMQAAIEATMVVVTMLVVGFSAGYLVIDDGSPQFEGLETRLDSVYFTISTLSTVGFGDITAVGQAGRAAVTLQILFDLSVLAMAVRALASAARRAAERTGQPLVLPRPAQSRRDSRRSTRRR